MNIQSLNVITNLLYLTSTHYLFRLISSSLLRTFSISVLLIVSYSSINDAFTQTTDTNLQL